MKPRVQKKPEKPQDQSPRVVDTITGTEHDFNASSVEEWEERVFRAAILHGHFTTWYKTGVGKGKTKEFRNFAMAVLDAWRDPRERTLVYAVASGRSVCIVRSQWNHYLEILKQMINEGLVK